MSIKDRRKREREQRRNDIINAAEKLFFAGGYDDVSMNDIANEVELSKATLYLYFNNKEELFFSIVLRGTLILNSTIKAEVQKSKTGIDKVSAFRKAYNNFTNDYPDYMRIYKYFQSGRFDIKKIIDENHIHDVITEINGEFVVKTSLDEENLVDEYLKRIMELRSERLIIMCNSIKTGIDDGTIRPDVDPVEAAVLLSSISKKMSNIPLDHEKILESRGIDHDKFVADVEKLIRYMIMNSSN
ncbi:MAG: TetR/AcrR family transcriptional regulator [Euryarchaeota archaeon]|jgi:AcrR family transcriptional regulator|uniref:TetR/AcrR family transcriptional regulator n=1 Tax=Methanobacterium sp. MZD130B TaxID=3394378 RepID=UPI00176740E3|nr:TetR/AcrR family transcriptional regulator [Euryarchaeota archaeon]HHT18220.1 TetR/AcrR family transcriptional regulator [Methanobacterium sp.]